eukprot:Clim_evm21s151 gene=Clim_evmTU21s151
MNSDNTNSQSAAPSSPFTPVQNAAARNAPNTGSVPPSSDPITYGVPSAPSSARMTRTPGSSARRSIRRNLAGSANRLRYMRTPGMSTSSAQHLTSDLANSQPPSLPSAAPTSDGPGAMGNEEQGDGQRLIWGTSVDTDRVMRSIKTFIQMLDPETGEPIFTESLRRAAELKLQRYDLDLSILKRCDATLYRQLLNYPQEVVPMFDDAVTEEYCRLASEEYSADGPITADSLDYVVQVRPYNAGDIKNMRELDPQDINTLVTIKGIVIRCSSVIPDLSSALYKCENCQYEVVVANEAGNIREPEVCDNCQSQRSMAIVHNRGEFKDKQLIKLQETPEHIPEGQTPHTVQLYTYDELVDSCLPGDRVEVTGIFTASSVRITNRQRAVRSVFRTHLDTVHMKVCNAATHSANDFGLEADNEEVSESEAAEAAEAAVAAMASNGEEGAQTLDKTEVRRRVAAFREFSQDPDVVSKLIKGFAPSIWEMEEIKLGLLCQLFGGTNKSFARSGRGKCRGDINILMCGDPGTSKSQLLRYVHKVAPRGIYTSGKGSSSVGLTAYVTRDPDSNELVLESGALVLSDGGVCCIDEFDKMNDATRAILHEAMEQQTISIAKAGIICMLNARTSILAAANPTDSKWDPTKSIMENIQLPPTLVSRFDLIYLVIDTISERNDTRLANHIISLYYGDEDRNAVRTANGQIVDHKFLADYIAFARATCRPKLTNEASDALVDGYVEMRRAGANTGTVTATLRQLESLIRISEACAKMRLSRTVDAADVSRAIQLVESALLSAATDPTTGQVDMGLLTSGTRSKFGEVKDKLKSWIREQLNDRKGQRFSVRSLMDGWFRQGDQPRVLRDEVITVLHDLYEDNAIRVISEGQETYAVAV